MKCEQCQVELVDGECPRCRRIYRDALGRVVPARKPFGVHIHGDAPDRAPDSSLAGAQLNLHCPRCPVCWRSAWNCLAFNTWLAPQVPTWACVGCGRIADAPDADRMTSRAMALVHDGMVLPPDKPANQVEERA